MGPALEKPCHKLARPPIPLRKGPVWMPDTILADALAVMEKLLADDERDEVDPSEHDLNEDILEATLERLTSLAAPVESEISPRVPDLIAQFDSLAAGATRGDPMLSEVSPMADTGTGSLETPMPTPGGPLFGEASPSVDAGPGMLDIPGPTRGEPMFGEESPSADAVAGSFETPRTTPGEPLFSEMSTPADPNLETPQPPPSEVSTFDDLTYETPQPRRRASRPMSELSREEVFSSAKKLNKDLDDIKQSLTGFVSDLNDISGTIPRELSLADSQSSLLAKLEEEESARNTNSFFFDICGGLVMSVFVVFIVLAMAAWMDETSFTTRPV